MKKLTQENFYKFRDVSDLEIFCNDKKRSAASHKISNVKYDCSFKEFDMLWAVLPLEDVEFFSDKNDGSVHDYYLDLVDEKNKSVYFPINRNEADSFCRYKILTSGYAKASASYRTYYYEYIENSKIKLVPRDNSRLMIKTHLEKPIPGVEGSRVLTRNIVKKCISFSREIKKIKEKKEFYSRLFFAQEEFGMVFKNRGAIFRRLPMRKLIPAFSLSSPDERDGDSEVMAITILRVAQNVTGIESENLFGLIFAKPLFESVISAFLQGFLLEMHMQNTLFEFNECGFVDRIYYRDFEGIIFSNSYRKKFHKNSLIFDYDIENLDTDVNAIRRFYNRNIDHDLGRILDNIIDACIIGKFWDDRQVNAAIKSARFEYRKVVKKYGLYFWSIFPIIFRLSRGPYGNGTRRYHYYKSKFR